MVPTEQQQRDAPQKGRWLNEQLSPELSAYFEACARIRNISFSELMRQLIETVGSEQMVEAILDDHNKPQGARKKYQRGYRDRSRA